MAWRRGAAAGDVGTPHSSQLRHPRQRERSWGRGRWGRAAWDPPWWRRRRPPRQPPEAAEGQSRARASRHRARRWGARRSPAGPEARRSLRRGPGGRTRGASEQARAGIRAGASQEWSGLAHQALVHLVDAINRARVLRPAVREVVSKVRIQLGRLNEDRQVSSSWLAHREGVLGRGGRRFRLEPRNLLLEGSALLLRGHIRRARASGPPVFGPPLARRRAATERRRPLHTFSRCRSACAAFASASQLDKAASAFTFAASSVFECAHTGADGERVCGNARDGRWCSSASPARDPCIMTGYEATSSACQRRHLHFARQRCRLAGSLVTIGKFALLGGDRRLELPKLHRESSRLPLQRIHLLLEKERETIALVSRVRKEIPLRTTACASTPRPAPVCTAARTQGTRLSGKRGRSPAKRPAPKND